MLKRIVNFFKKSEAPAYEPAYHDKVRIISGFYRGQTGRVIGIYGNNRYLVKFENKSGLLGEIIHAKHLEKINE